MGEVNLDLDHEGPMECDWVEMKEREQEGDSGSSRHRAISTRGKRHRKALRLGRSGSHSKAEEGVQGRTPPTGA